VIYLANSKAKPVEVVGKRLSTRFSRKWLLMVKLLSARKSKSSTIGLKIDHILIITIRSIKTRNQLKSVQGRKIVVFKGKKVLNKRIAMTTEWRMTSHVHCLQFCECVWQFCGCFERDVCVVLLYILRFLSVMVKEEHQLYWQRDVSDCMRVEVNYWRQIELRIINFGTSKKFCWL